MNRLFPHHPKGGSVSAAHDKNAGRSLAHSADTHGVWLVSSVSHPAPLNPQAARHRVNKGRDVPPFQTYETRPAPERAGSGGERPSIKTDSSVMADLDETEPPAERLRRCDGDTEPQTRTLPVSGGSAPPLRLSRPAVGKETL